MAAPTGNNTRADHPRVGLLTKTIVQSPVIRWILPARIRHRKFNDVVYVGENFIEIKEVRRGGHVESIIEKRDLCSKICSAGVFTIEDLSRETVDDIFEHNIDYENLPKPVFPAQLLVLVLEANVIMFLYLAMEDGDLKFRHQMIPLPKSPDSLRQVGEHLAIDPQSRAMAVASRAGQILLYSAKRASDFRGQLGSGSDRWCPVNREQIIDVPGAIQHIAFLHPKPTDTEHVILLAVVTNPSTRRTSLSWWDWRVTLGIRHLQQHDRIPIDVQGVPKSVSSLVIPLCNTNFLLINGRHLDFYKDLLSGTPSCNSMHHIDSNYRPECPGTSPRFPLWSNWCRPMRSRSAAQGQDQIYLCREDGKVFHLVVEQVGNIHSSYAGDLQCHAGDAFASLGDDMNPDLLAAAADMSNGRIVSIGSWPSNRPLDRTRQETMNMTLVELLPNWASVTDMIVAKTSSSNSRSSRTRDSVFLTSGRQPYGTITELRRGLEAKIITYFPLPDLSSMLGVWTLPDLSTGFIILLLSTPASTAVVNIPGDLEEAEETERDTKSGIFCTSERTLAADITSSNQLVQITEKRIIVAGSITAAFEDKQAVTPEDDESIVCAIIEPELDLIASCNEVSHGHSLAIHSCPPESDTKDSLIHTGPTVELESRPLCMASAKLNDRALVLVADESGLVQAYSCGPKDIVTLEPFSLHDESPCDQMVLLCSRADCFTAVCSTRDGKLITVPIRASPWSVRPHIQRQFGLSTVKLTRVSSEPNRAYATCGTDTCLLELNGSENISIQSIWATDRGRPELPQNQIFGCARLPSPDRLSREGGLDALGDSLVMLSASELWITSLGRNPVTIPRQIPIKGIQGTQGAYGTQGTPYRLTCAHVLKERSLICASMKTELTESQNRRRCFPIIEVISLRTNEVTASHTMEPGEEVYSLLEWSPVDKEKSYQFVLVGSKYLRNSTDHAEKERGRITFLQPHRDGIRIQYTQPLQAPVYSMALYDELTFAVCYGTCIALYRFSFADKKVRAICQPVDMAHSGVSVTCEGKMIYVTTTEDSIVAFCVRDAPTNSAEAYQLFNTSTGPRANVGVSHTVMPYTNEQNLAIMSTRRGEIIGFAMPVQDTVHRSASILFEAALPQSVTRLRKCEIRPAWRPSPPDGVLADGLVGCFTDGSLIGLAVLDEKLWRRLFWIQRLCEWNEKVSPHTHEQLLYTSVDDGKGHERALPIGLSGSSDIMLWAPDELSHAARGLHIDGDVLARMVDRGGASALRSLIETTSRRQDHVGEWLRTHLEAELAAVDGCFAEISALMDSWL